MTLRCCKLVICWWLVVILFGHPLKRAGTFPASSRVKMRRDNSESSGLNPYRCPRSPFHLRHPQHRCRSPARRGRRHAGAVSQYRRPGRLRLQDAAAPDRGSRTRAARGPQHLRSVRRHSGRARGCGRGVHGERISGQRGSCVRDRGHVGRHRAHVERRGGKRRRSARADADLSALHGRAREARRESEVLPARSVAWLDARSGSPEEPRHPGDARARHHRPEQPDRRGLPRRNATRTARLRRPAWPADPGRRGVRRSRLRWPRRAIRPSGSRRANHFVLEPVEGVSRAGLAHGLDGRRPLAAAGRCGRCSQEAG